MAKEGDAAPAVKVISLPVVDPPAPASGGRIMTPAGELTQIFSDQSMRHVAYIEFLPDGKPRGNHYHKKKHQYVYVIKGKLEVRTFNLVSGERSTYTIQTGDLDYCPPNIAHVHIALGYTQALDLSPQPYEGADTIKYQVV